MTQETFGQLEQELPPARFMRVRKSYLVALDKIESVERNMIPIGNRQTPVSEPYKKRC